jgi:hypothetical protein
MADFEIIVKGDVKVSKFIRKLETRLKRDVRKGMFKYIRMHLVPRIKHRLKHASERRITGRGEKGLVPKSGGYGMPKNHPEYAKWKKSKANLPATGDTSPREMIATGHFVDLISVTKATRVLEHLEFTVGPKAISRPKAIPFKDQQGATAYADLNQFINNLELAQMLEEGKYKFWAQEYEDVLREIKPYLETVIRQTIIELLKEYGGVATL